MKRRKVCSTVKEVQGFVAQQRDKQRVLHSLCLCPSAQGAWLVLARARLSLESWGYFDK